MPKLAREFAMRLAPDHKMCSLPSGQGQGQFFAISFLPSAICNRFIVRADNEHENLFMQLLCASRGLAIRETKCMSACAQWLRLEAAVFNGWPIRPRPSAANIAWKRSVTDRTNNWNAKLSPHGMKIMAKMCKCVMSKNALAISVSVSRNH